MDIPMLSMAMSQASLQSDVSTLVLSKTMDDAKTQGEAMTRQLMELSVTPSVGGNFDMSI